MFIIGRMGQAIKDSCDSFITHHSCYLLTLRCNNCLESYTIGTGNLKPTLCVAYGIDVGVYTFRFLFVT